MLKFLPIMLFSSAPKIIMLILFQYVRKVIIFNKLTALLEFIYICECMLLTVLLGCSIMVVVLFEYCFSMTCYLNW